MNLRIAISSIKLCSLIFALIVVLSQSTISMSWSINIDVTCTVYKHSDDQNGDNVDVRMYVMGLKPSSDYTAQVIPDHNPSVTVMSKTDYEGIFWSVGKVPNGEKSLMFNVKIYEGNGTSGNLVVLGDDDAPCQSIAPFRK